MASQNVSREADERGLLASLCVGIVFVMMRTAARWFKCRRIPTEMEDLFMYLALVSFAITCALYYATTNTFFNAMAIIAGEMEPYASLEHDLLVMLHEFFTVQFFFWLTLWSVKWSLLAMFKRLTDGLPWYNRVWWGVLIFSVLTFIGCCISNFTSCSSMRAWFTPGLCTTARDSRAKQISLWFGLGADLTTDLLIMAVPVRVLWDLKISLVEKLSVGVIFLVGVLTMITAIIRSVSLDSSVYQGQVGVYQGQVSTTWLMLWACIEGVVAIITGCLPSFAVFVRRRVMAPELHHDSGSDPLGYHSTAGSTEETGSSRRSRNDHQRHQLSDTTGDRSLADGGIMVTRRWSQKWQDLERGPRHFEAGHGLDTIA
ncbi:uncharacterized protein MAM_05918 [Metarhizium album ARSEF 1941]|uniref:Rhodopsin domain-containing protein n=1 Tax=Metarhizium album (strain ARSEF 1941) TaxID=1081103 RepID=A0A0B2WS73_METAS|nr:uncharacterized protein MAM_05918 [Metarhizium album ARSEF 1941]KHN96332.1 hypothetical protein MAM_05918 [Metarhizium album ARSEF 1941]